MATHYDSTIGNDVAMDTHCEITMVNDIVAWDIHCDVAMISDIAVCTYYGIKMHNDITMNLFYYVLSALCLIMLFYYG